MGNSVGYWQSCSGCTEGEDGYVSEKYFPIHKKYGVHTGAGCDECKGKGVVFVPFTKAHAAYWEKLGSQE